MNYINYKKSLVIFLVFAGLSSTYGQQINLGTRLSIYSKILNEDRPISVYLPPTYYSNKDQNFPVLYILDGDYNFRYVTGLIELQSSISENIPEMIVVGISGKGSTTYKRNCKPKIEGIEDAGNAEEVVRFIKDELITYIRDNYRANDYKILGGHSVGGLFVINTALIEPNLFNNFVAISPALWWADNAINKVAKSKFKEQPNLSTNVYVSLANEKGMGVKEFLKLTNEEFQFKQFKNENHNSVGEPTYKWALNDIFKTWKVDKQYFESAQELKTYNQNVMNKYSQSFNIPNGVFYNSVIYILKDKQAIVDEIKDIVQEYYPESYAYLNTLIATNYLKSKEYLKAELLLKKVSEEYSDSFLVYQKLAETKLLQNKKEQASLWIDKSIDLAKKQQVRQWQLNELIETKESIIKK